MRRLFRATCWYLWHAELRLWLEQYVEHCLVANLWRLVCRNGITWDLTTLWKYPCVIWLPMLNNRIALYSAKMHVHAITLGQPNKLLCVVQQLAYSSKHWLQAHRRPSGNSTKKAIFTSEDNIIYCFLIQCSCCPHHWKLFWRLTCRNLDLLLVHISLGQMTTVATVRWTCLFRE